MLPLQPPEWYQQHPKPVNVQNNLDVQLFQQGLRLTDADHDKLANELLATLKQNVIGPNEGPFDLRNPENKTQVSKVLDLVISKRSAQYGWNEIGSNTVKEYMFELAKRCLYNWKRSLRKTAAGILASESDGLAAHFSLMQASPQQPHPQTPPPLVPPRPPFGGSIHHATSGPSMLYPRGLTTPAALGASTPLPSTNVVQGCPLHESIVYVRRADTGEDYEDTIDMFLSLEFRDSRHLNITPGPGDYNFTIFKNELAGALSYNEQSDMIGYFHNEKGFVEVNQDSKWRVALRHLGSKSSSGMLNFEIQKRGGHSRFGGHNTVGVSAHSTLKSSSLYAALLPNTPAQHLAIQLAKPPPKPLLDAQPHAPPDDLLDTLPDPPPDPLPRDPLKLLPTLTAQQSVIPLAQSQLGDHSLHLLASAPRKPIVTPPKFLTNDLSNLLSSSLSQPAAQVAKAHQDEPEKPLEASASQQPAAQLPEYQLDDAQLLQSPFSPQLAAAPPASPQLPLLTFAAHQPTGTTTKRSWKPNTNPQQPLRNQQVSTPWGYPYVKRPKANSTEKDKPRDSESSSDEGLRSPTQRLRRAKTFKDKDSNVDSAKDEEQINEGAITNTYHKGMTDEERAAMYILPCRL